MEFLHDLLPSVTKIGTLFNPQNPTATTARLKLMEAAASKFGIRVCPAPVADDSDFDPAFETLIHFGVGALLVSNDPFYVSRRERITTLAAQNRIPTLYSASEYVRVGGLMSYGGSLTSTFVILGDYAGRILKGEKPADLPVQVPTKYGLVINLKTAKALGLNVPVTLLAAADEAIE
jgi:putative ABC transport system substrate-binding protein